jgi:hypothetical protein
MLPNCFADASGAEPEYNAVDASLWYAVAVHEYLRRLSMARIDYNFLTAELARRFPAAQKAMGEPCALWLVWPKQASGVPTDLDGNRVRELGLQAGLVDYKVAAIDATWSGLCFARRKR